MAEIEFEGILQRVDVDFGCEQATPIVRVKQGDKNGRKLLIYPRENGQGIICTDEHGTKYCEPYEIKCELRVQRPDGAVYTTDHVFAIGGIETGKGQEIILNRVGFSLDENMLAVAGRAYCDVYFWVYGDGYEASTAGFYLDIDPKPTATSSGGLSPSSPINIEEVAEESWGTFTPSSHTLYIVTGENSVKMYFGSTEVGGNGYNETQTDTVTDAVEEVTQ